MGVVSCRRVDSHLLLRIHYCPLFTGHINHSLFWKNLAPTRSGGGDFEDGPLKNAVERVFGGVPEFKKAFNAKAAGIQGSGWAWLVCQMDVLCIVNLYIFI
jgi:superoxide dismutase